jgi:hypothetical protein
MEAASAVSIYIYIIALGQLPRYGGSSGVSQKDFFNFFKKKKRKARKNFKERFRVV